MERAHRPAWREQAEKACFAEGKVRLSHFIQPRGRAIDGPGICGLTQPLMVGAIADDQVQLDSVATLDCPMVAALNAWVAETVQPIARARFGQPVVQIDTMGSYSCRSMNGVAGSHISEHAFGNALDIAGFRLADGRRITVVRDWTHGDDQSQAFLRDVHAGACNMFTTVLGPGYNAFHYNHIHVDLAMHGGTSHGLKHYCKPVPEPSRPGPSIGPPQDNLPEAPPVDEELDVASSRVPSGGRTEPGLVANAPPPYEPAPGENYESPGRYTPAPRRPAAYAAAPPYEPTPGENYNSPGRYTPAPRRPAAYAAAPPAGGSYREDGAFEPEGDPGDWDVTSSIKPR